METSRGCKKVCVLLLCLTTATTCFNPCDARRSMQLFKGPVHARSSMIKHAQKLRVATRFDSAASLLVQKETMDSSNSGPYVSSPFTLPPYDSLGPISLPDYAPPYCIYPPNTPQPPSTAIPTPAGPPINTPGTPEGLIPSPPGIIQGPPESVPSPPEAVPRPPYYEPSPPSYTPSPPTFVPSPAGSVPSPRSIRPPVVYPPPTGPPSPRTGPSSALCYWQRSRVAGGLCSFGGTAILVTMDPSYDGCRFMYE
ncbi:hypothetical protein OIU76_012096 [Salix suchowensis]|nr:hypothetical protein OIU76_012096 [Salix suchowensis]